MKRIAFGLIVLSLTAAVLTAGCTTKQMPLDNNQIAGNSTTNTTTSAAASASASTTPKVSPSVYVRAPTPTPIPPAPTPTPIPTWTSTPSGKQIVVVKGQQFSIALRSNPTTGYHWQPTFNAGALASTNSSYVPDVPMRTGSGGTEVFTFQALRAGTTSITFDYVRSWESGTLNETSYTVIVR